MKSEVKVRESGAVLKKNDIPKIPLISETLGCLSNLIISIDDDGNAIMPDPPKELTVQEYLSYKLIKQLVETKEPLYKQMETLQKLLNQNKVQIEKTTNTMKYNPFDTNPLK